MPYSQNRLFFFFLSILLSLILGGCGATKSHLKLISEGKKPKVAFVVSLSDDFHIYYTGTTIFENKQFKRHTNVELNKVVSKELHRILLTEDKVDFVFLTPTEVQNLENSLNNNLEHFRKDSHNKEFLSGISKWGADKQFDYIAFLFPGSYAEQGSHIKLEGNAIVANYIGLNATIGIYKMQLIDIAAGRIADFAQETAFCDNPNFKKKLSQEEKDEIIRDMKASSEYDQFDSLSVTNHDSAIYHASLYKVDDYEKLSQSEIDDTVRRLLPSTYEKLARLIVRIGFSQTPPPQNTTLFVE
ncbi:MAG: hypothetical protein JAZ06_14355 [Candidatus Thiodiazotropha taylori]|nr:hypothetical protein [Candidatus Thiodiazotropha taylori]